MPAIRAMTEATAKVYAPIPVAARERLALSLDGEHFIARMYCLPLTGTHICSPSAHLTRALVERIPERTELKDKGGAAKLWRFAATDFTVNVLDACLPKGTLEFDDQASRHMFNYHLVSGATKSEAARIYANYREHKTGPAQHAAEHPERLLKLHQRCGMAAAMVSEGYGLFFEQGTGKTPTAIGRICADAFAKTFSRPLRVLIVCPKNVRMNWENETALFSTASGVIEVLRGGEFERRQTIIETLGTVDVDFQALVMSYETMTNMADFFCAQEWDLAILDESHYIKRPETKRFKAAMRLRDACRRRMCLTGTPITNTPLDLYAQLEFLQRGGSGFHSWSEFKKFYGQYIEDESGRRTLVGVQNMPFMQERLASMSMIVTKEEALPDLPEKMYDVLEVEMSPEQQDVYDSLAQELAFEAEQLLDSGQPASIITNCILTQMLRLGQITSGFIKYDDVRDEETGKVLVKGPTKIFDPCPKLDTLMEELKGRGPLSKTIIWSCWVPPIHELKRRCDEAGLKAVTYFGQTNDKDREYAEWAFNNDPETRIFIGNPAAGGTGLNLLGYPKLDPSVLTNVDWEIYLAQNWSPTARWQSEDRGHRNGTRVPVRVTDLCVAKTIDEEIRARVLQKKKTAMTVADVREILRTVLRRAA